LWRGKWPTASTVFCSAMRHFLGSGWVPAKRASHRLSPFSGWKDCGSEGSYNGGNQMMRKTLVLLVVACGLVLPACKFTRGIAGSGVRKTEKRELKSFNAIDTAGAYEIDVTCQKPASFEIEADDNILPLIKTEVRDGILFVGNDQPYHSSKPVTLRITLPDLNSVSSHGAGQLKIADVNSSDLKIESTGAASVHATGRAKSVTISSTGAGEIDTSKLQAQSVKVDATGA